MKKSNIAAVGGVAGFAIAGASFLLAPSCPRTDACLTWVNPTHYTNGQPIPANEPVDNFIWRDGKLVVTPRITGFAGQAKGYTLRLEPAGQRTYTVQAIVMTHVSAPSDPAGKFIRAPGPTDGAIEAPSDGGIEDVP